MDDLLTHAQKEFAQNPVEVIGAALSILVITLSTLSKAGRGFWAMLWARVRSAPGEKGPTSFQVASPVMTQNFNPTFNPIINIHPAVTATPPAPPTIQAAASVAPQQQTDWTLYDRRRKIFEDIQEFIAYVLRNNGDFELAGPGEYRDFRRNMDVAEDLYGTPDVRAVLKAFDENVREFWASAQTRKRAIETGDIKAINRNHELLSGIISFGERIPEVFKSHLAAGGNTGKSAESPRMALRPTGKYPTVVQGWSYFSISVCNEDKRYGESLYGVRGYLSFTSPRGKRHQEQEALFCIRRPAEEFPFDFREVVPELALGIIQLSLS